MEKQKRNMHALAWMVSGALLLALNAAVVLGIRSQQSAELSDTQPGFWAGSILLVGGVLIVDLIWLGLFIFWLARRRMGISENEHVVHPASEHPREDPSTQEELTN